MDLIHKIFSIKSSQEFEQVALEVYNYQSENCLIYRQYIDQLNWKKPTTTGEIPFLPISFFKSHSVRSGDFNSEAIFMSSGTGGNRSQHHVKDLAIYERSFTSIYTKSIGAPLNQVILALLPNYLEQGDSSLVYMVDHLMGLTNNPLSGFILDDPKDVINRYYLALEQNKKIVIFGVSYALLDLCKLHPELNDALIIETGGMKGRRKEMTKSELHATLKRGLNCRTIYSEYGMTELLSQAYSGTDGLFEMCPWMKIVLRDISDPFTQIRGSKTGGVNIIDLANIHSCSFIATDDLGRNTENGFELMGRYDQSDIRGCNQLIS